MIKLYYHQNQQTHYKWILVKDTRWFATHFDEKLIIAASLGWASMGMSNKEYCDRLERAGFVLIDNFKENDLKNIKDTHPELFI